MVHKADENGKTQYLVFDRHDFLYQDEAGEWKYNTDFLFSCDSAAPLANDRQALWKEARMNFQQGAMGPVNEVTTLLRFWTQMEKLHYPMAGDMRAAPAGAAGSLRRHGAGRGRCDDAGRHGRHDGRRRHGMNCPACGLELMIYRVTMTPDGERETEYVCRNPRCGRYDRRLARKEPEEEAAKEA